MSTEPNARAHRAIDEELAKEAEFTAGEVATVYPERQEQIGDFAATIVDLRDQIAALREEKARVVEARVRDRELLARSNNRVHALKEENEKLSKILWEIAKMSAAASFPTT